MGSGDLRVENKELGLGNVTCEVLVVIPGMKEPRIACSRLSVIMR